MSLHEATPSLADTCRRQGSARRVQLAVKRFFDVVGATILLVVLSPIMLLTALAVWTERAGPVVFAGMRCGAGAGLFRCYKFRTMRADQDAILRRSGLVNIGADGRLLVFADDPRISSLGRMLRRTSIDELPQLFNVLRGDMSLIGPRPLVPSMLEADPAFRMARARMRPGITGLWQVSHRAKNAAASDMIADDLTYIATFSLLGDAAIAWRTLGRIVEPPVEG